jgi:NAD(P)-dependent dehydrogenase (short-subunit alcohol dehydrogenase family)
MEHGGMPDEPKTALVTGSTHGVGRLVARGLADQGFQVILHGRDEAEGRRLQEEIGAHGGSAEFLRADFASLDEVRRFADEIARKHKQLQLLINNAGIGFGVPGSGRELSADGHEMHFAVNYLAPFLLTHLLRPLVITAAPARIVNIGSLGQAPLDFDDVMLERGYDGVLAYRRSKLALVMFTMDLAEALEGKGVTVNCVHPATFMDTAMVREAGVQPQSSPEEGAEAILHLALDDRVRDVTGAFFDGKRLAAPNPQAGDLEIRRRLRELSLQLTGLADAARMPAAAQELHPIK